MRWAATEIQALARAVTARVRVKALRGLRAAIHVQRFERGRSARAYFRKHLQAVASMQRWSRSRLQRMAFLRILRLTQRLQHWFHRVVKEIRLRKTTGAVLAIQRRWRGVLGRQAARGLGRARARLQESCRKLVLRWRGRVLGRLRQKLNPFDPALCHAAEDTTVCMKPPRLTTPAQQPQQPAPLAEMLEKARRCELSAATALLQRRNGALANQAELLQQLVQELQHQLNAHRDSGLPHQLSRMVVQFLLVAWDGWREVASSNSFLGYL